MRSPSPYWTKERHADRRGFLHARAQIAAALRAWFADEEFVEVEPSALVASPGAEVHLQAFETEGRYLHTSPEFAMKKLLAAGEEKIYFLGKVWRAGEVGPLHTPEFTMLEWYRADAPYQRVMEDCIAIARLAARTVGATALRWREKSCDPFAEPERLRVSEAFARYAASFPFPPPFTGEVARAERATEGGIASSPLSQSATRPDSSPVNGGANHDDFSAALVTHVEPHLGSPALTLLYEYPIAEAALARACLHDASIAERFELYACGVELANGFGELTDPAEQHARLEAAMAEKEKRYGVRWPIDEDFLAALAHMPPASGCALGFDRLVMLATGARRIEDVLWTP